MKLKKSTPAPTQSDPVLTPQISEAVRVARTASRSAFDAVALAWRHAPIDALTWDSELAALTIQASGTTATLAVPNRYHGECAQAMINMEPTFVYACLDEAEAPTSLKVYLSTRARPDWNICLRPEAAVLQ
jgi:cell division septation protein DedD